MVLFQNGMYSNFKTVRFQLVTMYNLPHWPRVFFKISAHIEKETLEHNTIEL